MSSNPRGGSPPGPKKASTPSAKPAPEPVDKSLIRHQLQILAWIRYGLGALSGIIAGSLPFTSQVGKAFNSNSYADIYFAVFLYIGSYYIAKYGLKIHMPFKDRNKLITQGIGGFVMMFIFFWILYTTCVYSGACPSFLL